MPAWDRDGVGVSLISAVALFAICAWVPRTASLDGVPLMQELSALRRVSVWGMMTVAAVGVGSIFAVYTFIGPIVTDVAGLGAGAIPAALAIFGIGMTVGNIVGGRMADIYPARGLLLGYGSALFVLAALASGGAELWILFPALFGVGAAMMAAIPTIQVRLTRLAPGAPSLVGAMNLASLNLANAIGAWCGSLAVGAGLGLLSAAWAGFGLTLAGLIIFAIGRRAFTAA